VTSFGRHQYLTSDTLRSSGALGALYARIVGFTQVPSYGRFLWFRRALGTVSIDPDRVLDAGCGGGAFSLFMAETFPRAHVRGIDVDEGRVRKCQEVASRAGIGNVEFGVDDLTRISDRETFDLIYSIDVIQYIEDNRDALARFFAALKPGGYLYVRIPALQQHRLGPKAWLRSQEEVETAKLAAHEQVGQHFDLSGLSECLEGCGFRIVYAARTNGFFGKLAFEVSHVLDERCKPVFALAVPLLKGFYWLDVMAGPKKEGNGLIVLAQRPAAR
jgi:SAM-dependent methyltransferase